MLLLTTRSSGRPNSNATGGGIAPPLNASVSRQASPRGVFRSPLLNTPSVFTVILVLNALWFGVAFGYFSLTPNTAARLLVPESARESPLFPTIAASVQFLGGMNLAFSTFAVLVLLNSSLFPKPGQRALFAGVFSLAHASQAVSNLAVVLRGGRVGESLWPVLSGPMAFIFIVDVALMVANAALAAMLLAP